MRQRAYKYRLYPNKKQETLFAKHFGCVRFIYNWGLELKTKKYQTEQKSLSFFDTCKLMKQKKSELSWLTEVNSQSLQVSLKNLDSAFTRFFREKKGFPKFRGKHKLQSFACPQNVKIDYHNSTIILPKIGEIKTVFSRQFTGKIKTCTISKTTTNKYFISILVETPEQNSKKPKIKSKTAVGIDLGLKDFATLSDATKISNPRYLRTSEQRLKVLQRRASKKKKGSNNRKKAFLKVARQHEKIKNQRDDFLHKLSTKLVRENQTICLETLNVVGMLKNHNLAKSISDASWSRFNEFLRYKAEWYGCNILHIGMFEASSKTCSECGTIKRDLTLTDRKWKCGECGVLHDRDVNAAINIKKMALQKQNLVSPTDCGAELLESLPLGRAMKEESPLL